MSNKKNKLDATVADGSAAKKARKEEDLKKKKVEEEEEEEEENEEDEGEDDGEEGEDGEGSEDEYGDEGRDYDSEEQDDDDLGADEYVPTDKSLSAGWPDVIEFYGRLSDSDERRGRLNCWRAEDVNDAKNLKKEDEEEDDDYDSRISEKVSAFISDCLYLGLEKEKKNPLFDKVYDLSESMWCKFTLSTTKPKGETIGVKAYEYEPMRGSLFSAREKWMWMSKFEEFDGEESELLGELVGRAWTG